MKDWIEVVKAFGYIWLTVAVLLVLANIVGTWIIGGFSAVQQLLSALNVVNFILAIITVAPGVGALAWAEKLKARLEAQ